VKKTGFLLLLSIWAPIASAASFCVTNSSELQAALDVAENNGESDIIRIAQGNYSAPAGGFSFVPPIFMGMDEDQDIEIIGGWTAFFGNPCGIGPSSDPAGTVLDGNGLNRVFSLRLPQQGNVTVANLTFINGFIAGQTQTAGLRIYQASSLGYAGTLTVESNAFIANSAGYASGLLIGDQTPTSRLEGTETTNVRVLNNLFVGNTARQGNGGAMIIAFNSPPASNPPGPVIDPRPALTLAHNTILNNASDTTDIHGAWLIGTVATVYVASNNLWGNSTRDLTLTFNESQTVIVRNNNIQNLFTATPIDIDQGNISVVPEYESCGVFCIDRVPVSDSPLIDAGYSPFPPFQPWALPATDAAGDLRVRGSAVDIGAYEGIPDRMFSDRFEN